jgi:NAD(P)-dependent dehydrogenase (short-subunit alcohol dehydrogenase family)
MNTLQNQVVLVTGSTDGIGKQSAIQLAQMGATVLVHGRSKEKCETVVKEICKRTGNEKVRYYVADFASLSEVRRVAQEIIHRENQLNVLINNAGIGSGKLSNKQRALSQDGYELRLAVNYLAPFLLTHLLLPLLKSSAPAQVINVASVGQQSIDLDNIMLSRNYDPFVAYKQSKLALIAFTFHLAERMISEHVGVNCILPGSLLNTKMVRESIPVALGSAKSGAHSIIHLVMATEQNALTGRYFDQKNESKAHHQTYDRNFRERLWQLSEHLVGLQ